MEPLTPTGNRPFSFATGRLFHQERAVVPLLLARQRLMLEGLGPRKALVASNAGGGLSLLETFSRNTIQELRNAGYETTTLIGTKVSRDELRKQMPLHDLFLWEGHSGTLMNEYEFPSWDDPLPPTFAFLQSCLALSEPRVHALLSRGAVGIIGSSTRTYSGSGGACSLAFFNALVYDRQSVGDALRQSKNFLLAYSLLKEKRLGKGATRTGANVRSAWAFTLWGDPTLKLPPPPRSANQPPSLPFIRHEVHGNTIAVSLPAKPETPVRTDKYQISLPHNGRFAGLVRKQKVDERRPLVPLVFAEVHLPHARPGQTPHLSSRVPSKRWVFCWDERRRSGYLLVTPRSRDVGELRFHVRWETVEAKKTSAQTPAAKSRLVSDASQKRLNLLRFCEASLIGPFRKRGKQMSRTTLCAVTAAVLALLSVAVMVMRQQVLGDELRRPRGPGAWKVTLAVHGTSLGSARVVTAMPLDLESPAGLQRRL